MTALEAKLTAYRNNTNGYFHIAERRIEEAVMFGKTECAIEMSEIPNGTIGMLYELASILIRQSSLENKRIWEYIGEQRKTS